MRMLLETPTLRRVEGPRRASYVPMMSNPTIVDFASIGQPAGGRASGERTQPPSLHGGSSMDASVLLVDDHPANLLTLEAVLQPLGCNLVRATSGDEALKRVLDREFAVLLIDVMMPGLNGLETAELIRGRAATLHVPIIFLTAADPVPQLVSQAYARGAVDYLVKPFDPEILRSKVSVFIELFLKNQELRAQTEHARRREREALENRKLYEIERGARAHAEEVAKVREDAIAVVSHDLRNPMTSIAANAALLRRQLGPNPPDGTLARVVAIQRSVERMNSLVSDLLDTARMRSGRLALEFRDADIVALIHQAAELFAPTFAEKQQHLELSLAAEAATVMCDRARILQVLSNLLGNAAKFGPPESTISIQLSIQPEEVTIAIRDKGRGIPDDQMPHIFEPYWQAAQQRSEGLGLGLAIAKGIVEAHGARIWVESQSGSGTQFYFTLRRVPDRGA
jgi:signal transduction histidine kinase